MIIAMIEKIFCVLQLFICFHQLGVIAVAKHMKKLEFLTLDYTKTTDGGFIGASKHLGKLKSLGVAGCEITDQGLADGSTFLGNLEALHLGSQLITDEGIQEAVKYLHGLTYLRVMECLSITEVSIQSIIQNLVFLTVIIIHGCFTGERRERVEEMMDDVPYVIVA